MQVSTDCTTAVHDALAATGPGLTLEALLASLLAYHAPQQVCQALEEAVEAGRVAMACRPGAASRPELVFRLAGAEPAGAATAAPEQIAAALDDLIAWMGGRVDHRGDFDSTVGMPALFEAFARKYDDATLAAALQLAFHEALLRVMARPSNGYVTVSLAYQVAYSVVAYERKAEQVRLLHVRAGSAEVARRKVAAARPSLQLLALTPGRIAMQAADGQTPLVPQQL